MLKDDIKLLEGYVSYKFQVDCLAAWERIKKLAEAGEQRPTKQSEPCSCSQMPNDGSAYFKCSCGKGYCRV